MRINGEWATEESVLRMDIVDAFKSLLSDPGDWRASTKGLSFSRINEVEASNLERPFTEEEVLSALFDLNGDKALQLHSASLAGM